MDLGQRYWHDGNLQSITFEISAIGSSCLILSVLVYANGQDTERHQPEYLARGCDERTGMGVLKRISD